MIVQDDLNQIILKKPTPEVIDTMYDDLLRDEGISATRSLALRNAFNTLHDAICRMDFRNLKIFFSKSLNERLREYCKDEHCSDMEAMLQDTKNSRGGRHEY